MTNRDRPLAWTFLVAALVSGGDARAQAPDPALPGSFTPGLVEESVPVTGGEVLATDLHFPDDGTGGLAPDAGACPVIAFGHGFARSKARHAELGARLASRGFVVLIPDFGGADHSKNGDDLSALFDWARGEHERAGSRLFGRLDPDALGVGGYSAGGLAALLCGARDERVRAVALLDPVDSGGLGEAALGTLRAPTTWSWSEPSACNAFGSAEDLHALAGAPKRGLDLIGATHCDPEEPSDVGCLLICGGDSEPMRELYRRHATDWFEYHLHCDESYRSWIDGADILAEDAGGLLSFSADGLGEACAAPPPGPVEGLRVRRDGADLVLSWDPPSAEPEVTGFRLHAAARFDFDGPELVAEPPATEWRLPGAATERGHSAWRVRAFGPGGEGP
jgi:predicted dienelactone hydrolase